VPGFRFDYAHLLRLQPGVIGYFHPSTPVSFTFLVLSLSFCFDYPNGDIEAKEIE
jgi:hypothetical protein